MQFASWRTEVFASAQEFLAPPANPYPVLPGSRRFSPGLNGLELQKLVSDRFEMPIIFITGHGDIPTTVRARRLGPSSS